MQHNRETIKALLLRNNDAVERAILALYARQTDSEQSSQTTRDLNGQGFNAFDAKPGSYYAQWLKSGRHLSGHHLDHARKLALRYVGQLLRIAQEKQKAA